MRWNKTMLRSDADAVIGTASIGEDITERKRGELEILDLNAWTSTWKKNAWACRNDAGRQSAQRIAPWRRIISSRA